MIWALAAAWAGEGVVRPPEPTIDEVRRWAEEAWSPSAEAYDKRLRLARWAAALPQVDLDVRYRRNWDLDWEYLPMDGRVDRSEESLFHVLTDAGEGHDTYVAVRAQWDLGELISPSVAPKVWDDQTAARRQQREIMLRVTEVFFDRRRLLTSVSAASTLTAPKLEQDRFRLEELDAVLDAYTGGRFSVARRLDEF